MAVPFLRKRKRKKTLSSFQGTRPQVHKLGNYGFGQHVPQSQASREAEDEAEDEVHRLTERFQRTKHQHKKK